jgi:hypothetical protein
LDRPRPAGTLGASDAKRSREDSVSRLIEHLNTREFPDLSEETELEIMDDLPPVLATPAYVLGAGAVLTAAGAGYAIEEVLGD